MTIQRLIKEALAKSPLGVKSALEEELNIRISEALSTMMEEAELVEAVNAKKIAADHDAGHSIDVIVQKHLNKKGDNKDEILKAIQAHRWNKRMKKEEVELSEEDGRKMRDTLKSQGKHEEAGAIAYKHGLGRSYGPHFGMRSGKYAAETAFHKGYDKAANEAKKTNEEVDLSEGIDKLSDARVKFHVLKDFPHGSYTRKEMKDEHERRKRVVPNYHTVKPSLSEEAELSEGKAGDMKDGYYVANMKNSEITHDKPFADSKSAISHANKGENKTGYVHRVTKVKGGKVDKQWEYNGGHMEGGWEHFSDFKGSEARGHFRNIPKHFIHSGE